MKDPTPARREFTNTRPPEQPAGPGPTRPGPARVSAGRIGWACTRCRGQRRHLAPVTPLPWECGERAGHAARRTPWARTCRTAASGSPAAAVPARCPGRANGTSGARWPSSSWSANALEAGRLGDGRDDEAHCLEQLGRGQEAAELRNRVTALRQQHASGNG